MWAILTRQIETDGLTLEVRTEETDRLNKLATSDGPDVSAISIAWYPKIAERYQLLPHGGSVGDGYGPALVSREPRTLPQLADARIAVPGLTTTAYHVLRSALSFSPVVVPITPPERIFEVLQAGEVDAAVVIHEGRLTFADRGFHLVADLGQIWQAQTGLPLPLGGNAIRRDLGAGTIASVSRVLKSSIAHALANREEAMDWLLSRGGMLTERSQIDRYLGMYANHRTLDYGADGREAIARLLAMQRFTQAVDFAPSGDTHTL
jgi:1,4-dihydroxy-6-naphthoate synthase